MVTNRIGIIADDLTGANDSGVQLAKKGLSSTVVLDYRKSDIHSNSDVLIVDTNSRAIGEYQAYEATIQAASLLLQKGYQHLYKKVDSTLRGNIAVELAAVESVYQPEVIVIAPGFPKLNRQTIQGHHYVNGTLITGTEFAKDPKTPVKESFIPTLLQGDSYRKIALVDSALLKQPTVKVTESIHISIQEGHTWFVCDSETEVDLKKIAEVFTGLNKRVIWAGSAGLIEYLPEALRLTCSVGKEQESLLSEKTLTVSGSLSEVTKQQLLKVEGLSESFFIEVDPIELVNQTFDVKHYSKKIREQLDKNHFVLYVDGSKHNRLAAKKAGEDIGLTLTEVSELISKGLGLISKELLSTFADINGLVLTGGDTAKAVCSELEITEMDLYSEVEPGLPFGKLRSEEKSYWAVTKAGGFGNERSLVKALTFMTSKRKVEQI
ncbi:four-carbon acid sugar kinase family protein [Metabacillus herbersteinensis]|uniref:Four-carbon acid sugar kinase family protein n=1 Tax=Metabacillus herbersteinensis TaxID=283816 RepID=A0ABV6GFR7_9BACI